MRAATLLAALVVGCLACAAATGCGSSCDPAVNCVPVDMLDAGVDTGSTLSDSAAPVDAGRETGD